MDCFEPYAVCLKVANGPLFEFTAELCFWLPVSASMVPQAAKAGCLDRHLRFLLHQMAPSIDNGTGIDPLTVPARQRRTLRSHLYAERAGRIGEMIDWNNLQSGGTRMELTVRGSAIFLSKNACP